MSSTVVEINNPLVQHKLTRMRAKSTGTSEFRRLMHEVGLLMAYEVTRELPTTTIAVETPVGPMMAPILEGKKLCIAPILRAGLGLAEGFLDLIPAARVAHIGLYRDPNTLEAVEYYAKTP